MKPIAHPPPGNLLLVALAMSLWGGCENYEPGGLPVISALDERGCGLLVDTLFLEVSTVGVPDLQLSWLAAADTTVAQLYDTLLAASAVIVHYPADGSDTSYALLEHTGTGSSESAVAFMMSDHLDVELVRKDGAELTPRSAIIPLETIADCPTVKTRLAFELAGGTYLVRFILTEASRRSPLRLAILPDEASP